LQRIISLLRLFVIGITTKVIQVLDRIELGFNVFNYLDGN